jgi:hypothetical protein
VEIKIYGNINGKWYKMKTRVEDCKEMLGFEPRSLVKRKELYLSYIPT